MDIATIALTGVIASLIVQALKKKLGTTSLANKIATVIVSVILGGAYYFLRDTSIYTAVLGTLASASTVYAFLLKR